MRVLVHCHHRMGVDLACAHLALKPNCGFSVIFFFFSQPLHVQHHALQSGVFAEGRKIVPGRMAAYGRLRLEFVDDTCADYPTTLSSALPGHPSAISYCQ